MKFVLVLITFATAAPLFESNEYFTLDDVKGSPIQEFVPNYDGEVSIDEYENQSYKTDEYEDALENELEHKSYLSLDDIAGKPIAEFLLKPKNDVTQKYEDMEEGNFEESDKSSNCKKIRMQIFY